MRLQAAAAARDPSQKSGALSSAAASSAVASISSSSSVPHMEMRAPLLADLQLIARRAAHDGTLPCAMIPLTSSGSRTLHGTSPTWRAAESQGRALRAVRRVPGPALVLVLPQVEAAVPEAVAGAQQARAVVRIRRRL